MTLNPQFPNYSNSAAGTEIIGFTIIGGYPLYRLPVAYVNTGFGAAFVCEGSTTQSPTFPEGEYIPDPDIASAGTITGTPQVGQTLTFTPGAITGTAPITAVYNWIRYVPGGNSIIVGTGLNYVPVSADITYQLIVQTVASNAIATIGTQTAPYSPIVPGPPVITNAGSISSIPPNPVIGSGAVSSFTITGLGSGYVWLLGTTRVLEVTGDGAGAAGTVALNPIGNVIDITFQDSNTTVTNGFGTIILTGGGSEVPVTINWMTTDPSSTVVQTDGFGGGTGWTQANLDACIAGTYGSKSLSGSPFAAGSPTILGAIGCPLLAGSGVVTSPGSGYNTATTAVISDPLEAGFVTPGTAVAVLGGGSSTPYIYPTELAVFSGPTVTGFSPQVSWAWGFGSGAAFVPFQLGGLNYRVQPADVGKEIFVKVTATNTGGSDVEYSAGIVVQDSAPVSVLPPQIGPPNPYVGDLLTGEQGRFSGYPTPQVTDWGFAEFLLPTPSPVPNGNKVYTYRVPPGSDGKRYVFYVTATNSAGTITAYSTPTQATFEPLTVVTPPVLTGFQSPAQFGDVLTGTPAVFNTPAALTNYFAYQNNDGTYTQIAGTVGTTTRTIGTSDVTKSIVYVTQATAPGQYGTQTVISHSNSTGTIRRVLTILTNPTITWSNIGPAPAIGATLTITAGTTNPALAAPANPPGNPYTSLMVGRSRGTDGVQSIFFNRATQPLSNTQTFVITPELYNKALWGSWSVAYNDGNGSVTRTINTEFTLPVVGSAPAVNVPGVWSPFNIYTPGNTLTFTPSTFTGNPTPTATWSWKRRFPGDKFSILQQRGLTYQLPPNSEGWEVLIVETFTNIVGETTNTLPDQTIGGPIPYWDVSPTLVGSNLMTPTQGTYLTLVPGIAKDPISGNTIPAIYSWYVQYPGQNPVRLDTPLNNQLNLINENGRWTGAQIYAVGVATNAVGSAERSSNIVNMIGTPRLLSAGVLTHRILPNTFGCILATADGGGQTVTSQWVCTVQNGPQVLARFFNPATSAVGIQPGTGTGNGEQTFTNAQGTTTYGFPEAPGITFI